MRDRTTLSGVAPRTVQPRVLSPAWHLQGADRRAGLEVEPGTFVKVPAHEQHSVTNTGTEDLIFLVIYDPPPADNP
jgi:oxalate decarboxylase/phosphoglucose isomerase-like protein (cupin superfamily)